MLESSHRVLCPYCGEEVEIVIEADVEGEMVRDCEVCCHPWRLHVWREEGRIRARCERLDD